MIYNHKLYYITRLKLIFRKNSSRKSSLCQTRTEGDGSAFIFCQVEVIQTVIEFVKK